MDVRMPDGTLVRNVPDNISKDELLARYQSKKPTAPLETFTWDDAKGAAAELFQGGTAGWGDEFVSGMNALIYKALNDTPKSVGDIYAGMKEVQQLRRDQFKENYPKLSTGLQIVGGLASPAAKVGAGWLGKAKNAADATARASAIGAGYSGAEYLGREDDPTAGGFAGNVALGAALPAAVQGLGTVGKKLLDKKDHLKNLVTKTVEDSGYSPADLAAKSRRMGPEASLADVSGESGVAYGQAAIGKGGAPARSIAKRNMAKLDTAQDRIRKELSNISGTDEFTYYNKLDELDQARKQAAKPYYEAAFSKEVQPTEDLIGVLQRPAVKDLWQEAQQYAVNKGKPLPNIMQWDKAGNMSFTGNKVPSLKELQIIDQELGKRIQAMSDASRAPVKPDWTLSAKLDVLRTLRKDLNNAIRKQIPEYGEAKRIYAGGSDLLRAQDAGKAALRGNMDDRLKAINMLPEGGGKEAYTQGMMSDIYTKIGAAPEDALSNMRQLRSRNTKTIMDRVLGPERSNAIQNRLKTEQRYREVGNKLTEGSQTELRASAKEMLDESIALPTLDGQALTQAYEVARKLLTKRIPKEDINDFVDVLTKPGGVEDALAILERQGIPGNIGMGIIKAVTEGGRRLATTAAADMAQGLMSGDAP